MPKSKGFCKECGTWVFLKEDGSCEFGHSPESIDQSFASSKDIKDGAQQKTEEKAREELLKASRKQAKGQPPKVSHNLSIIAGISIISVLIITIFFSLHILNLLKDKAHRTQTGPQPVNEVLVPPNQKGVAPNNPRQIMLPSQSSLPLTKKALESLKKLKASTQAGISYVNYGPMYADVVYTVDNFLNSSEAGNVPVTIKQNIIEAREEYGLANDLWNYKFSGEGVKDFIPDSDLNLILGSSVSKYKFDNRFHFPDLGWSIDHCISAIWSHASECVEKADREFNTLRP